MRETPPFFRGQKTYPARWWKQRPAHFFPRWFPEKLPVDPHRDRLVDWLEEQTHGLMYGAAVDPQQVQTVGKFADVEDGGHARLANGIIRQALLDVQTGHRRLSYARRRAQEAYDWFFSNEEDLLFSFLNCCAATGRDPTQIRWDVQAYTAAMRSRRTHTDIDTALGIRSWRLDKPVESGPIPQETVREAVPAWLDKEYPTDPFTWLNEDEAESEKQPLMMQEKIAIVRLQEESSAPRKQRTPEEWRAWIREEKYRRGL